MPINDLKGCASISTYQGLDGNNFTVVGLEEKASSKRASAGAFMGIGSNFKNEASFILDFKGSMNYDTNGILNQNIRIRNNIGTKTSSTQIRYSPLTLNVPVSDKTSLYVNPHYSGKINYKTDKWNHSAGVFAGATQKLSKNTSLSLEVQRYNLQEIKDNSSKNWGINAILSFKL